MRLDLHHVPGRLRMRSPSLRLRGPGAERVRDLLTRTAGVLAVEVRPRTGTLVVRYDPARVRGADLVTVALAGGAMAPVSSEPASVARIVREVGEPFARRVLQTAADRLLERSAARLVAALL